jgi:hypothetical protein
LEGWRRQGKAVAVAARPGTAGDGPTTCAAIAAGDCTVAAALQRLRLGGFGLCGLSERVRGRAGPKAELVMVERGAAASRSSRPAMAASHRDTKQARGRAEQAGGKGEVRHARGLDLHLKA